MGRTFREIDRLNRENNIKALVALRKQGVKFIKPYPQALKIWYYEAEEVPKRLVKAGKLSQKMVNSLESLLKEYRSKQRHRAELTRFEASSPAMSPN
jgi:hypothetical protein